MIKSRSLTLALALTATAAAVADTTTTLQTDSQQKSVFDKIWDEAVLYRNDKNSFMEEFDFTGRIQADYFNVASSRGDNEFVEIRRFRMGFDSWFDDRHVELKATLDTALWGYHAPSVFYNRFTDLFLAVHVNDALNLRAGKFEPHFGYDREFSDNYQKFFERSIMDDQVFNNLANDYVAGASATGKINNWSYQAAIFSDNVNRELGEFDGGTSTLLELNYDFSNALAADKALLAADFMHMETTVHSDVFNTLRNAGATYFDYQSGRFCFVAQTGFGNGMTTKGDFYQLMVMPSFYIIPSKLEALVRLQHAGSDKANGISLLNRQDKTLGTFTGDAYESAYFGLNYYFYGMKCRMMLAEQYDDLTGGSGAKAGFRGWTTLAGFRMFW